MARILVLYATVEGQTARIAERAAERLRGKGHAVELRDAHAGFDAGAYDAVIVGASVHYSRHPPELAAALKRQQAALASRPGAFFSVSLSARQQYATRFLRRAGWRPRSVAVFAGALKYSRYPWWKRQMLRGFALMGGRDTDPSRDYEYTDWGAVAHFADAFATSLAAPKA